MDGLCCGWVGTWYTDGDEPVSEEGLGSGNPRYSGEDPVWSMVFPSEKADGVRG